MPCVHFVVFVVFVFIGCLNCHVVVVVDHVVFVVYVYVSLDPVQLQKHNQTCSRIHKKHASPQEYDPSFPYLVE